MTPPCARTLDTARLNGAEPFGTILQTITP